MGLQQIQQATVPVHQHILSMATSPYGDNPIFKDLKPLGSLNEDALRPTNPAAQKAILESSSSQYKISPKVSNGLKVKPIGSTISKVIKIAIDFCFVYPLSLKQKIKFFSISEIIVWWPRRI